MSKQPPSPAALRVAKLSQTGPTPFSVTPDKAEHTRIAEELCVAQLRKLSFKGSVRPIGEAAWQVDATLGATVVQSCVITLEPVTTRIDAPVTRQFQKNIEIPDVEEFELPAEDMPDLLGTWIDPNEIMIEALALHIPEYPRAPDAELQNTRFAEAGVTPMTDDDAKPFAGLAALKAQMGKNSSE